MTHLTKFSVSKRQMKRLPSLLEGTGTTANNSVLSLSGKGPLRELSAKDGFLLAKINRDESAKNGTSTSKF